MARPSPDAGRAEAWRAEARKRLAEGPGHQAGSAETPDGRLDPRSLATALDAVLPERRTVVQDGGHFIGWAPMYWHIPRPQDLVMVGTAYQAIGLGLASAVGAARAVEDGRTLVLASGDGGFLMGLSDLESLIGAATQRRRRDLQRCRLRSRNPPVRLPGPDRKAHADPRGGLQRHRPRARCRVGDHPLTGGPFRAHRTGSTPAPREPSWPTAGSRRASGPRG